MTPESLRLALRRRSRALRSRDKPPSAPSNAIAKVFNTPELLQEILQHLSSPQLFAIRRTSSAFFHSMNLPGSARLWRAMSLQHESLTPQPPGSYVSICYLTPPAKIYFTEHFNEWLSAYLFPYANIAEVWCWLYCQPKATKKVRSLKRLLPCVGRSSSLERPSRFLDGPWKRVKLTRWPVSLRLHVHIKHETLGVWRYEQHTFQEGGKDTLGELHHVLEDLKARHLAEAARQAQP